MSKTSRRPIVHNKLPPIPPRSSRSNLGFPQAFSILVITGEVSREEGKFQKVLFEDIDVASSPLSALPYSYRNYRRHRRLSSTIVKSVDQSYDFCNALQSLDSEGDVSNVSVFYEHTLTSPLIHKKTRSSGKQSSVFASTTVGKSSGSGSGYEYEYPKEEHISTIYTLSSDTPSKPTTHKSVETEANPPYSKPVKVEVEDQGPTLKFNEDIFEVELFRQSGNFRYEQRVRRSSLGLLPTKTFCFKCNTEVVTDVCLRMPKVSRWKTMCCIGNVVSDCSDSTEFKNFEEFQHYCVYCRSLLGTVNPGSFA
mmetsp:Transcript_31541/g.54649  ORF Transcript_31541/g.54649 Transcript_31541/m.54649 type:complete len:309 (-) Transcript_31541:26-952(-)